MRAPNRRHTKMIGSRWLRNGESTNEEDRIPVSEKSEVDKTGDQQTSQLPQINKERDNQGDTVIIDKDTGAKILNSNAGGEIGGKDTLAPKKMGVIVVDNKKRKTDVGPSSVSGTDNT